MSPNPIVGRVALLGVAGYLFFTALSIYAAAATHTWAIFAVLFLYLGALTCLVLASMHAKPLDATVQLLGLGLVLAAISLHFFYQIEILLPGYGTDSIAFNHAAAELVRAGENPYEVAGTSLEPITQRFGVPHAFVTQTTDGDAIDRLMSYPAGSILVYLPFLAVGLDDMRWVTLAFELAAISILWIVLMGRGLSALALLPLLVDPNLSVWFTSGGVTDWIWVLPVLVSAVLLFHRRDASSAIFLGLACAVKQQPWLALPFVLLWIAFQVPDWREGVRHSLRFAAIVATVFVLVNAPFIVLNPTDWAQGVLQPALDNTVPDGQGLSILSSRGLVDFPKEFYSSALAAVYIGAIFLFCVHFNRTSHLMWVFPAVVMFVSYRSFQNYFMYWIPIQLVWLGLTEPWSESRVVRQESPFLRWPSELKVPVTGLLVAGVLGASALVGLTAGDQDRVSLVVQIKETEAPGGLLERVDVTVENASPVEVDLVFYLQFGGFPGRWSSEGTSVIGPHEFAEFSLRPQSVEAIPPIVATSEGERRPAAFRVRVNVSGESSFFVSDAIEAEPDPGPANGRFEQWLRPKPGTDISGPLAWSVSLLGGQQPSSPVSRLESDEGLKLVVSPEDGASEGAAWSEAAVVQEVDSLAECYELTILPETDYVRTDSGSPLAAVGLQIVQNGRSVWFVPSSGEASLVDLGDGTRIVTQSAEIGGWNAMRFDVESHAADMDLQLEQPALLKLFNAIHQSQTGSREVSVRAIREVAC